MNKFFSFIAKLIFLICFIGQIVLIPLIGEIILKNENLGWLVLCYVFCEIILNNYDTSVTKIVLSTIMNKDRKK